MRTLFTMSVTLTLVLGLEATAGAQVGRVAGVIEDEAGKPIKGATITAQNPDLSPSTFTASTDAKGRFSILGLRRGDWRFTIQAPGYETAQTVRPVMTIRPNAPLHVRLLRGALPALPGPLDGIDAADIQRRIDAAEALASGGDVRGAIAAYRELGQRIPALTSIHFRLGALYEKNQDPQAALESYRRLEQLEPGHPGAIAAIERLTKKESL
jgi:tetratricopeptide (TPR) repeat protein